MSITSARVTPPTLTARPSRSERVARIARIAPTTLESATNVASLLLAHAALVAFWALLFLAPYGAWLAPFAPLACLVHQKAISEWLHEGSHHNFVSSRTWNDRLLQWLAGIFFFEEVVEYRRKHMRHHQDHVFFRSDDPDTAALAIRTRRDLVRAILEDLLGVTAIRAVTARTGGEEQRGATPERGARARRFVFLAAGTWIALIVTLALTVDGLVWTAPLVYFATLITLYPVFNRLRVYAQHVELGEEGSVVVGSRATRTIRPARGALIDRCLVQSRVLQFHAEHHTHPALPYRQLERLAGEPPEGEMQARSRLALLAALYRGLPAR